MLGANEVHAMTLYVDDLVEWGAPGQYKGTHAAQAERVGARHGHQWCHLFADDPDCEELHTFAIRLGMHRQWFHKDKWGCGHYDLVPTKRALAVRLGVIELDRKTAVAVWQRQRLSLRKEPAGSVHVWLVGEHKNASGDPSFRIVEGDGLRGEGGWTVHVGRVIHWIEDAKIYRNREQAEARLVELQAGKGSP